MTVTSACRCLSQGVLRLASGRARFSGRGPRAECSVPEWAETRNPARPRTWSTAPPEKPPNPLLRHGSLRGAVSRAGATTFASVLVALAGGVGAARFLRGLVQIVAPDDVTVVVNTGDDDWFHGLLV